MAVLVEGLSVVVRCDAILQKYEGGASTFSKDVPNQSLCADGELASVAFMIPGDVRQYVELLERRGLKYRDSDNSIDLVVVDQLSGVCAPCNWVEYGVTDWNNESSMQISVCFAKLGGSQRVVVPTGWSFEKSLSAHRRFISGENFPDSFKLIRSEEGVDVFLDVDAAREFYVTRSLISGS